MPVDVAADVIANRRLSADYNVLALAAPAIAAAAAPGQFVMVKAGDGHDPLLRRPFSVFEMLRDSSGRADRHLDSRTSASARRRALLYDARAGRSRSRASARSAARSRSSIRRRSVDGRRRRRARAVRDARRSAARARRQARRCSTARAARDELFYLDFFRALGVELVLTTEDGSAGERGRVIAPLDARLADATRRRAADDLRVRAGRDAGRHGEDRGDARPAVPGVGRAHHGLRHGRLLQLRRPDARRRRRVSPRAIVHRGPVLRGRSDSMGLDPVETAEDRDPMDLSVRIGSLTLTNPADRGQRLLRLRRRVRRRRSTSSSLGGVAVKGLFLDRARRPSRPAHRRNAGRHAERDRPAGHRRAPVRRREAARAARARARRSSSTSAAPRSTSTSRCRASCPTPKALPRSS